MRNEFDVIAARYISPVLAQYEKWVVNEAKRIGVDHLYFLARDGYQVYHIAKNDKSAISCSYFYCSRYALRMAAYRFFDDSAYERLFIPAFKLTAQNMLERAGFDEKERAAVYHSIGFRGRESDTMGRSDFSTFCGAVKKSKYFRKKLREKSDAAYQDVIGYIRQEHMHECVRIGIVDLGWTGSMQHTLRRLLDSLHVKAELHGFYMGMLSSPPAARNNRYHAWLFHENDNAVKAWFSQNLMECLCSAPHGMTLGYAQKAGQFVPVLAENENNAVLAERIRQIIRRYTEKHPMAYDPDFRRKALWLLRQLMFSPTFNEANSLSQYQFCDDVGEQYHRSIVQHVSCVAFLKEILPFKLFNRESADGLYWYYGALAANKVPFKPGLKYGYFYTRRLLSFIRSR